MNKLIKPKLLLTIGIIILTIFLLKIIDSRSNEEPNYTQIKDSNNKNIIDVNITANKLEDAKSNNNTTDNLEVINEKQSKLTVEDYLNIILSSPIESSNPKDYIEAHREEYIAILEKNIEALKYMFSEFEKGEHIGIKGAIMEDICRCILREDDIQYEPNSPQDWYNEIKKYTIGIATKNSYEFVKEKSPQLALLLDKDNYYYAFDIVMFSDGMVEIAGEKLGYEKVDLGPLYETLTGKQIEQLMYRAVIYYKSVFQKDFVAVKRFSSYELNKEIDKWNKSEEVRSEIEVMMTLNNHLDSAFPNGIKAPIQHNDNFVVTLIIEGATTVQVTFLINSDGIPEVTDFQLSSS